MLRRLLGIEAADRRPTAVAFATLMAILVGHAMLETARDAMFLTKLPARYLSLAYLAIAALALVVSKQNQQLLQRFSRRKLLSLSLLAGGATTAGFWFFSADANAWMLGALYVWTGLLATVVVMQFWLLLSDVLDVGRAKRLYSIIGAGGLVGATLGSALAATLIARFGPRMVVLWAAAAFVVAAVIPMAFPKPAVATIGTRQRRAPAAAGSSWSLLQHDRYLRRLLLMLLLGAVLVTGVDFLFKAQVAAYAKETGANLGVLFARYYTVVNALALVVQLLVAPRLLQSAGVNRALFVTPALLLFAALGSVLSMGLVSVLILKGTDGTLRHSLHRTASEILFLPLPRRTRDRFKGLSESLGQRGGQALASVMILGVTALSADPRIIALGLVVLAIAWLATLVGLQPLYLGLFRKQLRAGMLDTDAGAAALDLASFELLVSALSAENDDEVIAALEMFDNYGKSDLIPALILYHPSPAVVLRAFETVDGKRGDVRRLSHRLLQHEHAAIRAVALKTLSAHAPDEGLLRGALEDDAYEVRCTALVLLIGAELFDAQEAATTLRTLLEREDSAARIALARTVGQLDQERYGWVTTALIETAEPEVLAEMARSFGKAPHVRQVPLLIRMLSDREARAPARSTLLAIGPAALTALSQALADGQLPRNLRLHVPRSISRFNSQQALDVLQAALTDVSDPRIEMKIVRGLVGLRSYDPTLSIDSPAILEQCKQSLRVAIRTLHYRLAVEAMLQRHGGDSQSGTLLAALLNDLHHNALRQLFRLLHIRAPAARFDFMYEGLRSDDSSRRASSRELLSHAAAPSLREPLLALVEDYDERRKVERCLPFFVPPHYKQLTRAMQDFDKRRSRSQHAEALSETYMDVLRAMTLERSAALPSIVSQHLAEIDLASLRTHLTGAAASHRDALREAAERALELLSTRLEQSRVR